MTSNRSVHTDVWSDIRYQMLYSFDGQSSWAGEPVWDVTHLVVAQVQDEL